jgi:hypothetical protein
MVFGRPGSRRAWLELRDDFVAQAFEVEAVYEISADERGKVCAGSFHIEAHGSDLVAVQNQFDFGLIQLRVQGRWESEHSAGGGLSLQLLRELQNSFRVCRRGNDEFHRIIASAGQRGRRDGVDLNAGNLAELALNSRRYLKDGALALAHGLSTRPPNPVSGKVIWNVCTASGTLIN